MCANEAAMTFDQYKHCIGKNVKYSPLNTTLMTVSLLPSQTIHPSISNVYLSTVKKLTLLLKIHSI